MKTSDPATVAARVSGLLQPLCEIASVLRLGRVTEVTPVLLSATLPGARMGELCLVEPKGPKAEIVGLRQETALLSPLGATSGMRSGQLIRALGHSYTICVGSHLIGHVVDGFGNILGGTSDVQVSEDAQTRALDGPAPDPLCRQIIAQPMFLGVKAIDAAMTIGRGQRVGIFAAAGVGKSTLLGMMCDGCGADVVVLALVGERGREVREFLEHTLTKSARKRSVVVVATSDRPAAERLKASYTATTIAEFFRDQGKDVLLLVDSLTRFARAGREIAMAAGEPTSTSPFPPSVIARLAPLLERSGCDAKGSITAIYTILVEGDNPNEPLADEVRSILDGHIILSRKMAEANRFPAIDVCASVSRVMPLVVDREQLALAARLRALLSKYDEISLLVRVGEYKEGFDEDADDALNRHEGINEFLSQDKDERVEPDIVLKKLREVVVGQ
ncbi:FliI/YscN family ATPase [Burkholderia sp. Bp8986]|uniref:FliI/YscN family ATPase n=1 Tax=Burkholderia sp. Bp8986 TaxID=2184550 RepID=UPI000F5A22B0|nr:FliI/YscN family ATPase [Burkholderia sp. Bp8986]RQS44925.1 FliI/YscN family ATPase [Burkholderia sp. Bp8986]